MCQGVDKPLGFENRLAGVLVLYVYSARAQAFQWSSGARLCKLTAPGRVVFAVRFGVGLLGEPPVEQFALPPHLVRKTRSCGLLVVLCSVFPFDKVRYFSDIHGDAEHDVRSAGHGASIGDARGMASCVSSSDYVSGSAGVLSDDSLRDIVRAVHSARCVFVLKGACVGVRSGG